MENCKAKLEINHVRPPLTMKSRGHLPGRSREGGSRGETLTHQKTSPASDLSDRCHRGTSGGSHALPSRWQADSAHLAGIPSRWETDTGAPGGVQAAESVPAYG